MTRVSIFLLAVSSLLVAGGPVRGSFTYLALGDSITFGNNGSDPSSTTRNNGDQGFVRPLADSLASLNGGVRPDVVNLGISGELSSSFLSAPGPADWPFRSWDWNSHYNNAATAQFDLMKSSIAAVHQAGNSVGLVTLEFGNNDISYLFRQSAYQNADATTQRAMILATIDQVQANYLTVLAAIKSLAPEAMIVLPNYFNFSSPTSPDHAFIDSYITVLNSRIAAVAASTGSAYVDIYSSFEGRQDQLLNLNIGDTHPNATGYAIIAADIRPAAVPEPSSLALCGIAGAVGLAWLRSRGRSLPN